MLSNLRQTLSSCNRIKRRSEFEHVLCANCLVNKWFVVYVKKNECGVARLGVIVGKKIIPKAVSRNFAKRLIRETFRKSFQDKALDIVVRVKRQLKPETSKESRLALVQLFRSI